MVHNNVEKFAFDSRKMYICTFFQKGDDLILLHDDRNKRYHNIHNRCAYLSIADNDDKR